MFYKLTKRSEGTKLQSDRGVLSDYLLTINILIDHIRQVQDDYIVKASDKDLASPLIVFIKECSINSWKKLDKYFAIVNKTPALYASIVTL
jgi:hypothetical protein